GIVVTYARSFKSNLGIGSLGNAFATFPDAILADTHRKLLALRDAMYAHRDKSKSFTRSGQTATPLYQLQIRFENADNTAIACSSNAPELNPANLPNVVKLCEFQSNKIQTEISKLLPNITGGKRYSPGTYTVGVDFP